MSDERSPRPERRGFPRANVKGFAVVITRDRCVGPYLLENLSASGALLVGDAELEPGQQVRLRVQAQGERFEQEARVVRHEARCGQKVFAVRFEQPSALVQDSLQALVAQALRAEECERRVLIVGAVPDDAAFLARELRALGREAVTVTTALEAIPWFDPARAPVEAAFVSAELLWLDGLRGVTLLDCIAEDYPDVARVLVGAQGAPGDGPGRGQGEAHAWLARPWDRGAIQRAIEWPS